jgi:ATP adenylyltransferase
MERMWAPWRVEYIHKTGGNCFLCEALAKKDQDQSLVIEKGALAFSIMNRFPYNSGHILVAPARHVGSFELLNDGEVLEIYRLLSRLIKSMNRTMKPHGYNIGINQGQTAGAGLLTHVHYHCVPRWQGDTNFMPVLGETKVISEGLIATYKKIKEGLNKLDQL